MQRMSLKVLLVLLTVPVLSACLPSIDYAGTRLNVPTTSSNCVAIGVWDQREYVVSGDKDPEFIGIVRGGFGNPFDNETSSGSPLALELAESLATSFEASGTRAKKVTISHTQSVSSSRQELANSGCQKNVFMTLREWKSDSMVNINFIYDFSLEVLGSKGQTLATATRKAKEKLDGSFWVPGSALRRAVPARQKTLLEDALMERSIQRALQ